MARPGADDRHRSRARSQIETICARPGEDRALRAALLEEIRLVVPFDAYVWVVTDPTTEVGASPFAVVPSLHDLSLLIRLKYLTTINRWTSLPTDRAVTLVDATDGHLDRSLLWHELLRGYGVRDIASVVFRDMHGCWGFLDLWRSGPDHPAFSRPDQAFLSSVLPALTRALRASLASTFSVPIDPALSPGPAVVLLTHTLDLYAWTPQTDAQLRALLPTPAELSPIPAVVLNVAAQLLAAEAGVDTHEPAARVHQGHGRWIDVRAARLDPDPGARAAIAVTIEPAAPSRRLQVYCRAIGLTTRETELVGHLVTGADTRHTARALGIAEHTVNDHLRSIFAKAGTNSRRQLVTNAHG